MNPDTPAEFDLTPPTEAQFQTLVADLSREERLLLLEHAEEAPFCGVFLTEKRSGVYTCRLCGLPLFKGEPSSKAEPAGPVSPPPSAKHTFARFATCV